MKKKTHAAGKIHEVKANALLMIKEWSLYFFHFLSF